MDKQSEITLQKSDNTSNMIQGNENLYADCSFSIFIISYNIFQKKLLKQYQKGKKKRSIGVYPKKVNDLNILKKKNLYKIEKDDSSSIIDDEPQTKVILIFKEKKKKKEKK